MRAAVNDDCQWNNAELRLVPLCGDGGMEGWKVEKEVEKEKRKGGEGKWRKWRRVTLKKKGGDFLFIRCSFGPTLSLSLYSVVPVCA